jgi:hypothetical protein
MAQTIALQRGSVTLSNNTSTLLFTNTSSGTATRLIVGYLSYLSNFPTVSGHCTFGILRSGASSPNFSMFAGTYPGQLARQVNFSPNDTSSGWHGTSGGPIENNPTLTNDNTGLIGASSMSVGNGPIVATYNKNVMLGPSDAIYCAWKDNGGGNRAAVIQYCFTLITE